MELKLNKKPLKNSTFQLKSNFSEMFKKQFLIVIVLPGISAKEFRSMIYEDAHHHISGDYQQ